MTTARFVVYLDGGRRVGCETAADVADLLSVLEGKAARAITSKSTKGRPRPAVVQRPAKGTAFLALMQKVKEAGTAGLSSAALARALGVTARGLGTLKVNGARALPNFPMKELLVTIGSPGDRVWHAGARIEEAIRELSGEGGE